MPVRFGRHWSFTDGVLSIFDGVGEICHNSAFFGFGKGDLVHATPEKVTQYIRGNLNALHHNNAADRFAYIGIDVYRAFQLYFEGALTIEALEDAAEDDNSVTLQMFLGDQLLVPFDIRRQTTHPVIFYDELGKAIVRL